MPFWHFHGSSKFQRNFRHADAQFFIVLPENDPRAAYRNARATALSQERLATRASYKAVARGTGISITETAQALRHAQGARSVGPRPH